MEDDRISDAPFPHGDEYSDTSKRRPWSGEKPRPSSPAEFVRGGDGLEKGAEWTPANDGDPFMPVY
jgi:hypothetical protein